MLVQQRDGPGTLLATQPADPLGQPWAAKPGPATAGLVGQRGDAAVVVALDPAAHVLTGAQGDHQRGAEDGQGGCGRDPAGGVPGGVVVFGVPG